jgi:alpha-D-ribose 1-methylphosphonate 5-phosphate C-P lyase
LLFVVVGALNAQNVPVYKVDASWPKLPLPNKWMMQGVPTMVVDKDDHIWVISRPRDITADESARDARRRATIAASRRRRFSSSTRRAIC